MSNSKIFETTDVDLAAFLLMEQVKFLEFKEDPKQPPHKKVVLMRFLDAKDNCRDLQRVFLGSDFKKYREYLKHLLKEIHTAKRDFL